jgi:hypothetical protein
MRLRSRKQQAKVQAAQESGIVAPTFSLDDLAVHDGDLRRGAAETQEADPQPDAQRLGERRRSLACQRWSDCGSGVGFQWSLSDFRVSGAPIRCV